LLAGIFYPIKQLGSSKAVEIRLAEANRLLINPAFEKYRIRAFIPLLRSQTDIIKGIDQSLSLECIKDSIQLSVKIRVKNKG